MPTAPYVAQNALDEIRRSIVQLDEMCQQFSPFVRGMGPEGQYWSDRGLLKPTLRQVEEFVSISENSRQACHRVIFGLDYGNSLAFESLAKLVAYKKHLHLHPSKEAEIRKIVRELATHARQFEVSNPVEAIQSKIPVQVTDNDLISRYIIKQEILRIIKEVIARSSRFDGEDVAGMCRAAAARIKLDSIIHFELLTQKPAPPPPQPKRWFSFSSRAKRVETTQVLDQPIQYLSVRHLS
jgi:hypothetical protein